MVADEKEIEFYCYFDISPICMLAACQYYNEYEHGICYGEDVCEYAEVEDTIDNCSGCHKAVETKMYYPPITDDLIINFLLLVGVENLDLGTYSTQEDKYKILEYVKTFKQSAYDLIRDLLIGHLQEWSRM